MSFGTVIDLINQGDVVIALQEAEAKVNREGTWAGFPLRIIRVRLAYITSSLGHPQETFGL